MTGRELPCLWLAYAILSGFERDFGCVMGRRVLVCGGAGYIGSHMCEQLAAHGMEVVVFDNLAGGRREHVRWGELVVGDLRNPGELRALFDSRRFDAVMQFAGKIVASESVREPFSYHEHNVTGMLNLLDAACAHDAAPVVFSSSAAVYGDRASHTDRRGSCLRAGHSLRPQQARCRADAERFPGGARIAQRRAALLQRGRRVAGGLIGEAHEPETHLIPNALRAAQSGAPVEVFGDDYRTRRWHLRARLRPRARRLQRAPRRARVSVGRRREPCRSTSVPVRDIRCSK